MGWQIRKFKIPNSTAVIKLRIKVGDGNQRELSRHQASALHINFTSMDIFKSVESHIEFD